MPPNFDTSSGGQGNYSAIGTTKNVVPFPIDKAKIAELGIIRSAVADAPAGVSSMSDITREEIDAKLEAVEARLETRLVSMESKMDLILNEVRHVGQTAIEAKLAATNIKWNVLFTALGTIGVVTAVILAMWAVGYQIADLFVHPPTNLPNANP